MAAYRLHFQVFQASERIDQLSVVLAVERDGHRVDAEIPAVQVVLQAPGFHTGFPGSGSVGLLPCSHELYFRVRVMEFAGAELLEFLQGRNPVPSAADFLAYVPAQADAIPHDTAVDIRRSAIDQQVPDISPDDVYRDPFFVRNILDDGEDWV